MNKLLWTVITILLALWMVGVFSSFGGPLIDLILVIAVILAVYNLVTRNRAAL